MYSMKQSVYSYTQEISDKNDSINCCALSQNFDCLRNFLEEDCIMKITKETPIYLLFVIFVSIIIHDITTHH